MGHVERSHVHELLGWPVSLVSGIPKALIFGLLTTLFLIPQGLNLGSENSL